LNHISQGTEALNDTPAQPETLDVPTRLRVLNCGNCGVTFALPASLYLNIVAAAGKVFCPSAHPNETRRADLDGELLSTHIELLAEVATLRGLTASLERELAAVQIRLPAKEPIGKQELKRRCKILAARAERTEYGRRLCVFCGRERAGGSIHRHYEREHPHEVADLPEKRFRA
jgi:hypothetical protein